MGRLERENPLLERVFGLNGGKRTTGVEPATSGLGSPRSAN